MRLAVLPGLLGAFFCAGLTGQDELTEVFCETEPRCSEDTLSIIFDDSGTSTFTYDTFSAGMKIPCTVLMSTRSTMVQSWSYGIASGQAVSLTDDAITMVGTDAQSIIDANLRGSPFVQNSVVEGGMISGVILDLLGNAILEVKSNSILKLTYTLTTDVGSEGSVLRFVDGEIGVEGSPPVAINITDNGRSLAPMLLTHGAITSLQGCGVGCSRFRRGDANGDGDVTAIDAVVIIQNAAGNLEPIFDCAAANDANGDGTTDIADGVYLLNYVFKKTSPVPPAPFRVCEAVAGADCSVSNCAG